MAPGLLRRPGGAVKDAVAQKMSKVDWRDDRKGREGSGCYPADDGKARVK